MVPCAHSQALLASVGMSEQDPEDALEEIKFRLPPEMKRRFEDATRVLYPGSGKRGTMSLYLRHTIAYCLGDAEEPPPRLPR